MSEDIVEYLERLVLIKFNDEERRKIRVEIDRIINLFNELKSIRDVDSYEPLFHVHEVPLPLRMDEALNGVDEEHEMLRENAVLVNGYVKAPKTMAE